MVHGCNIKRLAFYLQNTVNQYIQTQQQGYYQQHCPEISVGSIGLLGRCRFWKVHLDRRGLFFQVGKHADIELLTGIYRRFTFADDLEILQQGIDALVAVLGIFCHHHFDNLGTTD